MMPDKSKNQPLAFLTRLLAGIGLVLCTAALLAMAVLGSQMRLSGDDYCYQAVLSQQGFWSMQTESYLSVSMYNGNRYSLTLFSGLTGLLPPWGNGMLVIVSLVLWVAGLTFTGRLLAKKFQIKLSLLENVLIAEVFACLVLWGAPSLGQSLFWRSGMLPYFMPLLGGTWLAGLALWVSTAPNKWLGYVSIFLLAVLAGGFSETGAAIQGGFWALTAFGAGFCLLRGKPQGALLKPALLAVLGTLAAVVLLYVSPTTMMRRANMPEPLAFNAFIALFALNMKVYLWHAVMRRTLTVLLPLLAGLSIGWFYFNHRHAHGAGQTSAGWRTWLGRLIWLAFSALALIGCVLLPATFIFADYPPDRSLLLSQVVISAAGLIGGALIAGWLQSIIGGWVKTHPTAQVICCCLAVLMLLPVCLAPLQSLHTSLSEWGFFNKWATMWDARHQGILDAVQAGERTVHVVALDHVIEHVGELSPDAQYWYNNCAEMYYGLDAIFADQPGW